MEDSELQTLDVELELSELQRPVSGAVGPERESTIKQLSQLLPVLILLLHLVNSSWIRSASSRAVSVSGGF